MNKIIVTEYESENKWFINIGKYNHESDIEVTPEIGMEILRLQCIEKAIGK